jgi:hypothetical protein
MFIIVMVLLRLSLSTWSFGASEFGDGKHHRVVAHRNDANDIAAGR